MLCGIRGIGRDGVLPSEVNPWFEACMADGKLDCAVWYIVQGSCMHGMVDVGGGAGV